MAYTEGGRTDKRDWPAQDMALTVLLPKTLGVAWAGGGAGGLAEMNDRRAGRPFAHSDAMAEWAKSAMGLPNRQAAGLLSLMLGIARMQSETLS
jgi:hypothetical protein